MSADLPAHLARSPAQTPRVSYGAHETIEALATELGLSKAAAWDLALRCANADAIRAQRATDLEDVRRWQARGD